MNDWNKGAKKQSHVIEMTFFSYWGLWNQEIGLENVSVIVWFHNIMYYITMSNNLLFYFNLYLVLNPRIISLVTSAFLETGPSRVPVSDTGQPRVHCSHPRLLADYVVFTDCVGDLRLWLLTSSNWCMVNESGQWWAILSGISVLFLLLILKMEQL